MQQHADSTVAIKDEAPDPDTADNPPKTAESPSTTTTTTVNSLDDFMGRQVKRLMKEEDVSSRLPMLPLPRHEVMTAEAASRMRLQQQQQQGCNSKHF